MEGKMKIHTVEDLEYVKRVGMRKLLPRKPRIAVGLATCGIAAGADRVYEAFEKKVKEDGLDVYLTKVGCIGYCKEEPIVNVVLPGKPLVVLSKVSDGDVDHILSRIVSGRIPYEKALCRVERWDHVVGDVIFYGEGMKDIPLYGDVPFFSGQRKVVLRDAGFVNPEDIEEYIAVGGYASAYKALTQMRPSEIVEEVISSGLRGRGGAGFPTGLKWKFVAQNVSDKKYVICNADEGDPGAYMNRNEMESDPHMIIEGMIIGGYAVGASEGVVYVRAEYPLAIQRLKLAIEQAEDYGLLGDNIFGTGFDFRITIARGAGAFVCGEETALIASIEGKTGRPRPRPPFPAEKGLWGKPTLINNVETWSNIPVIVARGGKWFSTIGVENNRGTKVFSLVGDVQRVGLVEVPLGTPISTVVYDIGGGGRGGKGIKAVQTGGPSGGCIPSKLFSTPIDYEHLTALGSIMGSGGIVVMDEDTSMVETARFFVGFTNEESCGKCVPCREGLRHMLSILDRLVAGQGKREDLRTLEELSETVKEASLCGLGQTAPNPVLSTLKYFADEYRSRLKGE